MSKTNFDALLDLLAELPETADDVTRRGSAGASLSDERRRAVERRLREDPEARLALFSLALEVKRERADSEDALRSEVRAFAAAVDDRFDIDLLGTAAAHPDRFAEVPDGLFEGTDGDSGSA